MNLNKFEQFQHVHSRCEFDNLINCTYTKILSKEESEKNHELDRSSVVKQSCTDLDEILRSPPTAKDNDCDIEKEFDPYFAKKMKKIEKLLEEEKLLYIRCDGCSLGYCDAHSGPPHKKPVGIVTSMTPALSVFAGRKCPRCAQHQ